MNTKEFKADGDIEMYITLAIDLVEDVDSPASRIKLEGLLRYHNKRYTVM